MRGKRDGGGEGGLGAREEMEVEYKSLGGSRSEHAPRATWPDRQIDHVCDIFPEYGFEVFRVGAVS
jgi:hypothetical protein